MVQIKQTAANGAINVYSLGDISVEINQSPDGPVPTIMPYIVTDANDEQFASDILVAIKKNKAVLLRGPTGCGKTATIRHLAHVTNNPYRRMQLNGATNVDNFVGRYILTSQGTEWRDGVLVEAMKRGQWLILDELNMALPEIIAVLNAVMDDDKALLLDDHENEEIKAHPNFRIFACINPTEDYVGTKELNKALLDRFGMILEFDYPASIEKEKKIITAHTGIDDKFCKMKGVDSILKRMMEFAWLIRNKNAKQKGVFNCSTRQLIQWADLISDMGVKNAARVTILHKIDVDERLYFATELGKIFGDEENVSAKKLQEFIAEEEATTAEEELRMAKEQLKNASVGNVKNAFQNMQTDNVMTDTPF